jgi:1-aminocyclopropane-1-carboxylate deaminase
MLDVTGVQSPLVELVDERLGSVRLLLKRDDLIDPQIPGNKWRKLKYQLVEARQRNAATLLTFGGAYSNHVRAVAAAGRRFGFATIGIIRGEERPFNDGLATAMDLGMRLHYLDRATYRRKAEPEVLEMLHRQYGEFYLIPEGGSAAAALPGCAELVAEINEPFDLIACPVGTGGTLAGLSIGLRGSQRALGFAVLRGAEYLRGEVARLQREGYGRELTNWEIDHRFHAGGFARRTPELEEFVTDFQHRHGIELDWVYVAKALFGVFSRVREGEIVAGQTVVFVVTGPPSRPAVRAHPRSAPTART